LDTAQSKFLKISTYFLGFLSFVVFVYILMALKSILIPITISIFLTYLFHPFILYLKKYRIPKWLSLIIILIFICGLYYLIGLLIVSNYSSFSQELKNYYNKFAEFVQQILAPFNLTSKEFAEMLNIRIEELNITSIFKGLFQAGIIQNIFNSFSSFLADFVISLVFWIFMILGKTQFEDRLRDAFKGQSDSVNKYIHALDSQLQSYIIIKSIISLCLGTIVALILWAYGIEFAVFWGCVTFILNFIPNIGAFVSSILPLIMATMDYGFGFTTISLAIILFIIHNISGNFVEPHFLGRHMDLSTVFVLFSLIFWGWVWGIPGMFLSVPIAASIKILFGHIELLKPLAIIMGRKPISLDSQD
jgi:AI-2 transport protein TqsA